MNRTEAKDFVYNRTLEGISVRDALRDLQQLHNFNLPYTTAREFVREQRRRQAEMDGEKEIKRQRLWERMGFGFAIAMMVVAMFLGKDTGASIIFPGNNDTDNGDAAPVNGGTINQLQLQQHIQDLEEQLEEEEAARQKLQIETPCLSETRRIFSGGPPHAPDRVQTPQW